MPHAEVTHQVGQVDGPDAPGEPQLPQGTLELTVVQMAQVPAGRWAAEVGLLTRGSWPGSPSSQGPTSHICAPTPRQFPPFVMKSCILPTSWARPEAAWATMLAPESRILLLESPEGGATLGKLPTSLASLASSLG